MSSIIRNVKSATSLNGFFSLSGKRRGHGLIGIAQQRFKSVRQSYVHGHGSKPMIGVATGYFVDLIPESKYAEREAVIDCLQGIRKTFIQYKEDIDKLAMGFLSLNLNRGDRLGVWMPNRYEWAVTQLAAAKAGLILVTLNPAYQVPELEYCLKKLGIRGIVIQENFKTQEYYKMMTKIIPEIADTKPASKIKSSKHPYFDTLIMVSGKPFPGSFKYEDIMQASGSKERQNLEILQSKIQFDEPANVQFTSGTTGVPKGATLSHHNMIHGAYTLSQRFRFDQSHRLNVPVPLFHTLGCVGAILAGVIHGGTNVLPSTSYDPERILSSIQNEKCTVLYGSPTMFIDMFNHPDFHKTDFSSVQLGVIGGAPCPPSLIKKIIEEMHCAGLMVAYGATELCGGVFTNHPDDPIEEKMHSCGRVYDYMEGKVIDRDGNIVPIGTPGEICVRGYKVMLGYWGDEEKTKQAITPDGWYKTGDIGILNEDGTLQVKERITDMIIRGGENIYPTEIEDLLITHPKIAESQVVGIPDERMGEEVCVWIRLKDNQTMAESEVNEFCKGKIAHFKIPRYVKFVTSLPKTMAGKVQKFVIREEMKKILNL